MLHDSHGREGLEHQGLHREELKQEEADISESRCVMISRKFRKIR